MTAAARIRSACAATAGLALLVMAFGANSALASEAVEAFSVTPSTAQAGAHPDIEVSVALQSPGSPEAAKDLTVDTPEGLFGNPNAIDRCSSVDFAQQQCPSSTQAGLVTIRANYAGETEKLLGTAPIYDLAPAAEQPALFGFVVPLLNIPIDIPVTVRTGSDYGLRFKVAGLTQLAPLAGADLTFWGFPAASSHDSQRFPKGTVACPGEADTACLSKSIAAGLSVHPLTDNPSVCSGEALAVGLEVSTYQDPDHPTHTDAAYPETIGCQQPTFEPVLQASPTTREADSPSGLDLVLNDPQPLGLAATPSSIQRAVVTMPEEFTINPDAADGQGSCLDSEAGFGTELAGRCPDNSKIGTFQIASTALDGPLSGSIYIGTPQSGNQYRLFLIADGFGIHVHLLGSVRPDPITGRVIAYFEDLPQVPFSSFQLHLFASDRGLMATPIRCDIYSVMAQFFPWNGALPDVKSTQFFVTESAPGGSLCPGETRPFHPRLTAGTANPTAGAFSDFTLKLDRDDGDQFLGDLNFTMPPGFTGDLRGISYCPEAAIAMAAQSSGRAEQATPSCPSSSQIGTTNVAAGPGSHPFHAVGKMYLAGPFKGAPLSLVAVTPALAGPYDYGTQVVRVALNIDPLTAQVRAVSDTVPSIIGGIPLRLRSIQVNIDREHFTINPTNCDALSVDSQGVGDEGTVANFSSYFHAVNCRSLPFKPKLAVRQFGGHKGTLRAANPALQFDLTTRPGDANIRSLAVTLPSAFEIDQNHLGNLCTEKELAATHCAGRQQIGEATTTTPLLDQPLTGPVYAVSGAGGLPRLAFLLNGQVDLLPRAETKTVKTGLRTTVPVVPDAPIGHFHLIVFGGKHGYLSNTRSLCAHTPIVEVSYYGQNGKALTQRVKVKAACDRQATSRNKRHRF